APVDLRAGVSGRGQRGLDGVRPHPARRDGTHHRRAAGRRGPPPALMPGGLADIRPLDAASIVLVAIAVLGLLGAGAFAVLRRRAESGLMPATAIRRAGSYAALAVALLLAARTGVPGVAVLVGGLA